MYEIIKNQLDNLGAVKYLLEEVRMEEYGDIELKKDQVAFIYEIYYEKEGYCTVDDDKGNYLEVTEGNTLKDTYNDADENIKTFLWRKVQMFGESFVFAGTGYNSYIAYVKATILQYDNQEGKLKTLESLKPSEKKFNIYEHLNQVVNTESIENVKDRLLL